MLLYRISEKTHEIIVNTEKEDEIVGEYMKKLLGSLFLLLLATACDSPQRNRLASSVNTGNGLGQPMQNPTTNTNPWTNPSTGGSTGGSTTQTKPPGFDNCDISAKYYASAINYMGICQSTLDETSVAVNSTVTDTARTCLIPTYKDNAGSSTYLGQPQCFAPQAGQIQMGQILKTRQGFTNSPINGVMVMKETALGAYFTCMDAYITFTHPQCPYGAKTNQYCDQMARSMMNIKCNNFKADNSYIDIRLK